MDTTPYALPSTRLYNWVIPKKPSPDDCSLLGLMQDLNVYSRCQKEGNVF